MFPTSWTKSLLLIVREEPRNKLEVIQNAFASQTRGRQKLHGTLVAANNIAICLIMKKAIVRDHKLCRIEALNRWVS